MKFSKDTSLYQNVIKIFGSVRQAGLRSGFTRQTWYEWFRKEQVPSESRAKLEENLDKDVIERLLKGVKVSK